MLNDLSGSVFGASPPPNFFFSKFFFLYFSASKNTPEIWVRRKFPILDVSDEKFNVSWTLIGQIFDLTLMEFFRFFECLIRLERFCNDFLKFMLDLAYPSVNPFRANRFLIINHKNSDFTINQFFWVAIC